MKPLPTVVAALAFIAAPALAGPGNADYDKCVRKAPEVVHAISEFCTQLGYKNVVPNGKATKGWKSKYHGHAAKVFMAGDCNPGQWVPKDICFDQFYNMCARGDKKGNSARHYGRNGCQRWYINN